MIGNWKTNANAYVNGKFLASGVGTGKTTRFGKKGIYTVATVTIGKLPTSTSYGWLLDTGEYIGYSKQGSKTLAVWHGTWTLKNNIITHTVTVNALNENYTQTITTKIIGKNKLSAVSTTSNGVKIDGTSTKN
jgi:hypothetical protein